MKEPKKSPKEAPTSTESDERSLERVSKQESENGSHKASEGSQEPKWKKVPRGSKLTDEQKQMREEGLCAAWRAGKGKPCTNKESECTVHCGVLSRTSGLVCANSPSSGSMRCRHHGGRLPKGVTHYNAKHMRYSKHLPKDLAERFNEALEDPELISMRQDLALLHIRIEDLAARLQTGENSTIWADLKQAYDKFTFAMHHGNTAGAGDAMTKIGALISKGVDVEQAWEELFESIERKTVVAGREWKRLSDLQQLMTMEEAVGLITAVMASVNLHVEDQRTKDKIARDLALLLHQRSGQPRISEGGE